MSEQRNDLLGPNPRAVIGGNMPPIGELITADLESLAVDTATAASRALDLIESARERAVVTTEDEAERATQLFATMREHWQTVDQARTERKAPYLEGGRIVDNHFAAITLPLVGADPRRKVTGAAGELLARVNAYRQEQTRLAEVERQRLQAEADTARQRAEEAERRRAAAEQARKAAESATAKEEARRLQAEAELDRRQATDQAATLQARAAAPAPVVIRSGYGPKASGRVDRDVKIVDLRKALARCLVIDRHKIEEAVLTIYRAQLRAKVEFLPGAEIVTTPKTVVRSR